ncbi:SDR family NAD(P)-dependent oxidoreductase, partial [Kitasatospora aburaviensis]
ATHPDENITDLPHTPLWGLTRSAQSEHPHRITLIDTDNHPTSWHTLPTTLTTHPQHALRNGTPHTPHLTHHTTTNTTPQPPINPNGTILITGGTGTLATHIARHLTTHHGARHLLLASRSGPNAPGATQLHTQLTALGATVTITACDTTDPNALRHLLNTIPDQHPLTTVIHTAGALHDATLTHQTPDHLTHTLTPK